MIKPYLPRRRTDVCTFGKCNTFLRQLFTRDRTAKIFPFLVHGSLSSTQTAVAAKHYFQGSILRVKGIDMLLFVWFGFVWFCLGWVGWLGGWVGGWLGWLGGWVVGCWLLGGWVVGVVGWLGGWLWLLLLWWWWWLLFVVVGCLFVSEIRCQAFSRNPMPEVMTRCFQKHFKTTSGNR